MEGSLTVESGATVKAAFIGDRDGSRYVPYVCADYFVFKSGSTLDIPENTLIGIEPYSYNDDVIAVLDFEAGSVINNASSFRVYDYDLVKLNGKLNNTKYTYVTCDEISIGGEVKNECNGYGYFEMLGTVTVEESGSVTVNNISKYSYASLEVSGPLTNKGKIELIGRSDAQIENNGYVNYNVGTVLIGEGSSAYIGGTKLINTGTISGKGKIYASLGDDISNYDDGTEYVTVENSSYWDSTLEKTVYKLNDYSRYKFTHDPAKTVDVIFYLAEVVNVGAGKCEVSVDAEELPE